MKAKVHKSGQGVLDDEMEKLQEKIESDKPQSRQSKRNVNKIVKYHEFEDDNSGEDDDAVRPRGRGKRKGGRESEEEFSEGQSKRKLNQGSGSRSKKQPKLNKKEFADEDEESDDENSKRKKDMSQKLNLTESDYSAIDFSCKKTTNDGKEWNLKISSWNISGLRAWIKKNGMEFLNREKPDIFCIQETKCSESKLPPEAKVEGYHMFWLTGDKEGYAGVALYSKLEPISVKYGLGDEEHDSEGRLITAEYEKFYLVVVYVPNAGRGLVTLPKRLKWDPNFRNYVKDLDTRKPVIICGDMNVSHEAIDLANPKTNAKNAGYTQEERDGMTSLLKEGFIDTFRHLYPDRTGAYTFWTYMGNARSRNVGWRLDYFIMSEALLPFLCESAIRTQVYGSDHCPITLMLHM